MANARHRTPCSLHRTRGVQLQRGDDEYQLKFRHVILSKQRVRCGPIVLNFIPRFEVATLRPPQRRLIPKLGGLPWGLPANMWPRCRECSMPMALLAQLPHQDLALDCGDPRWVLHLFQCVTAGCGTWSYDEGCNAAFMLPLEAVGNGLTRPPEAAVERRVYARVTGSTAVEHAMHGELWLTGWHEHQDAIPQHMSSAYSDPDSFRALPDEFQFPYGFGDRYFTKTGGVPYWTANGPEKVPPRPFEYLMQIDTFISIQGRLPDPSAIGCDVDVYQANGDMETRRVSRLAKRANAPWSAMQNADQADEYYVEFANFRSDGTAYVFVDRETTPPRAIFFWRR